MLTGTMLLPATATFLTLINGRENGASRQLQGVPKDLLEKKPMVVCKTPCRRTWTGVDFLLV